MPLQPDDPAQILAEFPGPVRLKPSRGKWVLTLLGCIIFVVAGFFVFKMDVLAGWLGISFFGLGVLISATMLMPGAGSLVLDDKGFEVTGLFRRHRSLWPNVSGFEVAKVPPAEHKMVVYDDVAVSDRMHAKMSIGVAGRNSGLPDTYGLTHEALASLMRQ
jgi:hypothetical protein